MSIENLGGQVHFCVPLTFFHLCAYNRKINQNNLTTAEPDFESHTPQSIASINNENRRLNEPPVLFHLLAKSP